LSGAVEILPKILGENLSRRHHGLAQALRTNSVTRLVQIDFGVLFQPTDYVCLTPNNELNRVWRWMSAYDPKRTSMAPGA
jgi:hypothetical protein